MLYRPYSSTTIDAHTAGHFDLLVRHYLRGEISSKLARLAPGDRMHFRASVASRFEYRRGVARRLGLVAAGTGIAPMWQARASSRSHTDSSLSRILGRAGCGTRALARLLPVERGCGYSFSWVGS